MASNDAALDLDLLAASLRADASDLGAFVESLALKLEDVIPGRVQVQRRRSGLMGPKSVKRIAVDLDDQRLELVAEQKGALQTRCGRVSGGIVLKNEAVDTDVWLAALGEALAAEARRSETTRRALARLLTN
jgi:hypothetical protein